MPDAPNFVPTFHDGCYCFRDAEAEAARASGLPVLCGGGVPCNCIDDVSPPYDALWDTILGDALQPRGGSKRPRSQCTSCSCACAILHAASAAANAAVAKIRRCCGGDCRCPPGLCRCPQEPVPVTSYACGALNEAVSQRVAAALQVEPQPSQELSPVLQALQPPASMSSVDITNVLHAALQGLPTLPNNQQPIPMQTPRASCCAPSEIPTSSEAQTQRQLSPEDLTNILQYIPTTSRSCCGAVSSKPQSNANVSSAPTMTAAELETAVSGLPTMTSSRPSGCCGGASSKPPLPNVSIPGTAGIPTTDLITTVPGLPALTPARPSGCCGGASSKQLSSSVNMPSTAGVAGTDLNTTVPDLPSMALPRSSRCCGAASSKPSLLYGSISGTARMTTADLGTAVPSIPPLPPPRPPECSGRACSSSFAQPTGVSEVIAIGQQSGESSRHSAVSVPARTSANSSTCAKSLSVSTPTSRTEPAQRSDERDRIFACHLCDASFKFKQNRDRHINEVHHGLRPHECDYPSCKSAFKNLSGLKQHKKTVHEKARPFKCLLCDRAFGQRNHLSQHVLVVHQKVKRYPCEFCNMAFSNVGNRTQHTKRRHPNELRRIEKDSGQVDESTT